MLLSRYPHSRSRNSLWISSAGTPPALRACLGVSSPSDSAREPRPLVRDEEARDDPPARDELASWDALLSDAALDVLTEPSADAPISVPFAPIAALMFSLLLGSRGARSASTAPRSAESTATEDPATVAFIALPTVPEV